MVVYLPTLQHESWEFLPHIMAAQFSAYSPLRMKFLLFRNRVYVAMANSKSLIQLNKRRLKCLAGPNLLQPVAKGERIVHLVWLEYIQSAVQ